MQVVGMEVLGMEHVGMENGSELLMLSGTLHWCDDCGGERVFVPVEADCAFDGCEFCCTGCDAAVFIMAVLENAPRGATGDRRVA